MNLVDIGNINEETLNVVTENGLEQLSRDTVLKMLEETRMDLVMVKDSPNAIYKIMDHKKYLYSKEKKKKQNRNNQVTKEIKFGINIQPHDIETKVKHIDRILSAKDKAKVIVVMHGRETQHSSRAFDLINIIISKIKNGKPETNPKRDRNIVSVVVKPF